MVWYPLAAGRNVCPIPPSGPLAHPSRAQSAWPAGPVVPLVCTALHRPGLGRAGRPNRLFDHLAPIAHGQVWVGDRPCPNRAGAGAPGLVWLDRCARKFVGWDVRETMPAALVSEALCRAPTPGRALVHYAQGSP